MAIFRVPAVLRWNGQGSPGVNIWHVRTSDPSIPGVDLGSAAAELDAAIAALNTWYATISANTFLPGMGVYIGEGITREGDEDSYDRPVVGPVASGSVGAAPPALAIVVGWRTTSATRRGRGRTFIGPLNSNVMQSDGTPSDTVLNNIRGANDTLIATSQAANGWALGVYGQQSAGLLEPKVLRDFTGHRVRDTFAVLRSRRD